MSTRRCFSRGDPSGRWSASGYPSRALGLRAGIRCLQDLSPPRQRREWNGVSGRHPLDPLPGTTGAIPIVTAEEIQALLNLDEPWCGPYDPLVDDPFRDGSVSYDHPYLAYLEHEARAATVRQFEPQLIPALLRTDGYLGALPPEMLETVESPQESLGDRILAQAQRWSRLAECRPAMSFVLDEAVIRRTVGSAEIMTDQLERLYTFATEANVSIKVMPFTSGAYDRMRDPFTLLQFDDPALPDLLYARSIEGDFVTTDVRLISSYSRSFDLLESLAPPLTSRREPCSHEN